MAFVFQFINIDEFSKCKSDTINYSYGILYSLSALEYNFFFLLTNFNIRLIIINNVIIITNNKIIIYNIIRMPENVLPFYSINHYLFCVQQFKPVAKLLF